MPMYNKSIRKAKPIEEQNIWKTFMVKNFFHERPHPELSWTLWQVIRTWNLEVPQSHEKEKESVFWYLELERSKPVASRARIDSQNALALSRRRLTSLVGKGVLVSWKIFVKRCIPSQGGNWKNPVRGTNEHIKWVPRTIIFWICEATVIYQEKRVQDIISKSICRMRHSHHQCTDHSNCSFMWSIFKKSIHLNTYFVNNLIKT